MFYIVLGFDGLFFYMVGHILSEMKLIKVAFENSNIQPQWNHEKRFRRATEHHIFVLQLCEVNVLNSLSNYLYFRVMQRSQRAACLTLAGFRNLDLNSFTVVCIKMPFLLFSGS
ncbi:uncharacterized protein LOC135131686 [Zophobas morio]|uniref:uncharacterized protein LOC135131686 n=1 Tax=Zophobas morio TaxID=2755281 RepID=UPI00308278AC